MSEIIEGGPVFVDVASGTQYPITELLSLATPKHDSESMDTSVQTKLIEPKETVNSEINQDNIQLLIERPTQTNFVVEQDLEPVDGRYRCLECPLSFLLKEKLVYHIRRTHKGQNPYQCTMCEYSTHHKSVFEEHIRVHKGIKPFKCSYCPYRSVSNKNTKKHELIHRSDNPLRCKECEFIARNSRCLTRHLQSHLETQESKTNIKLRCPDCTFRYKNLTEFRKHRKNLKQCKKCEFSACSRGGLVKHMTEEHGASKPKKLSSFTCSVCNWDGNYTAKILLHLIHHPNQKVDENIIDISILREHGIME